MLCEITIENVAVIEKANIVFGDGLNVLTGETGAGKSILIDSIGAILGSRASRDLVRTGAKKASIWATFNNLSKATKIQLQNAGYETDDELLLFREISAEGKSNCRINGMPVSAGVIRDICANLINIHGQQDSHSLLNPAKHIHILDAFAQNKELHNKYYLIYKELCAIKRKIDALQNDEDEKESKIELLKFQIDEISMADLNIDEEILLINERNTLRNAGAIKENLYGANMALNGADDTVSAVNLLRDASNFISENANLSDDFLSISEKIQDALYNVSELSHEVSNYFEQITFEPKRLEEIEDRLDLIYKLKKKYGKDIEEVLAFMQNAKEQLGAIEFSAQHLDELYDKQESLYNDAKMLAAQLTQTRLDAFEKFNSNISKALKFLNMPGIRLSLMHKAGSLASLGQDSIEFYISANMGETPKPMAKIASGGELSRIMLAIKSAMADKDDISTIIYDEIDTGVSGLAAARIGEKLKQTSKGRQIICITHTAQIAAEADIHLLIEKNVKEERTYTEVKKLDGEARVKVLAQMISGDKITDIALANAKEMLEMHNKR